MAQLSDDCFAFGGELMRAGEARAILEQRTGVIAGIESVPLAAAGRRILADDLVAERDVPPHDNAAVDGYAVWFADLDPESPTRLPVTGRVPAGQPLGRPAVRGEAIRIFTGAPMPLDAAGGGPDTVLMQEDCSLDGDAVVIPPGIAQGANRRFAGEDLAQGQTVLAAGRRLRAQDIGLAASLGRTELAVRAALRVAIFSTGDEVIEPGQPLPPGAIYDSNRYSLHGLLGGLGCSVTDLAILPDRADAIGAALEEAAREHDLIMTSGGVSTGEEDHVRAALEAHGTLHVWRLAIRPGRPLALGQVGRVPFVGLPGNPVAVIVTFLCFARPLILRLAGAADCEPARFRVPADFDYRKKPGRREWLRATLAASPDGIMRAGKAGRSGAGILSSTARADGLIELDEDCAGIAAGEAVDFIPFSEFA